MYVTPIVNVWHCQHFFYYHNLFVLSPKIRYLPYVQVSQKIENIRAEIRVMRRMFNAILDNLETELGKIKDKPISAKNAIEVKNDLKDYQKIKTAEFTVPVIYADVLYYRPGELGSGSDIGREGAHVYYTPESISDPEYLETVKRSAISVGTHEKNTGEYNRDVDGWPVKVWYDEDKKCVMVTGVVHGEENVAYVEKHKNDKDFGSSAYIDFLGVKKESGVSTTGNKYTAKTTKLVNNHIALLPNIRDRKNVIIAMNSLSEQDSETEQEPVKPVKQLKSKNASKINSGENEMTPEEIQKAVSVAVKNALNEAKNEDSGKKDMEEVKNSIKSINERLDNLDSKNSAKNKKVKNAPYAGEETEEEEAEEKEIEKKKMETENALNAIPVPDQAMIAEISGFYGMTYPKTPSFERLASDIGIDTKDKPLAEIISALNAKRASINTSAKNSKKSEPSSYQDVLAAM